MASIQCEGDGWHCQIRYLRRRRTFALGKVSEAEAKAKAAQVDYLLMRLKRGLVAFP